MLEEGVQFWVWLGIVGHLEERHEDVLQDVLETRHQLVGAVDVTETPHKLLWLVITINYK